MPSHAGAGSSAADGPAAPAPSWQHEPTVRAALREHWDVRGELLPLQAGDSRTWQAGGHVVKLARDEIVHFTAGLRASQAVERAGIATGAPVRTRSGDWCVPLAPGRPPQVLAVLRRVDGSHLSMHAVAPPVMGEFLGRLHRILAGCPAAGPGIFSVNGADISAIVDWGGVRAGGIADDIGCWTAHGATDRNPLRAYTAAFLRGYRRSNRLPAEDAAAVPLFQRLRIASRACYVTAPDALARVRSWMRRAFDE